MPPLSHGVRDRPDYDYARTLVGLSYDGEIAAQDSAWWKPYGVCEVPEVEIFVRELLTLFKD